MVLSREVTNRYTMHVLRYILGAVAAIVALSAAAIAWMPEARLIGAVPLAIGLGCVTLIGATVVALLVEDRLAERGKHLMMVVFLLGILVPTIYTAVAYIHTSQTSWSGGEVHYHADFEVIVDGERYNLVDPRLFCERSEEGDYMCRLNDRVGLTEYHEHNDQRIHLEGTFKTRDEATLAAFFEAFGGTLTDTTIRYPTNEGWTNRTETGNRTLKVLVERGAGGTRDWCALDPAASDADRCIDTYLDERVTTPEDYVISPYQRGVTLDTIFIIYDDTSLPAALADLRDDGAYTYDGETFEVLKSGEGY